MASMARTRSRIYTKRPIPDERVCRGCGECKPIGDFALITTTRPDGRATKCKPCVNDNTKWRNLHKRLGVGKDEYEELAADQSNKCAICGEKESATRNGKTIRLAVDHDHDTGAVRGLLCRRCNIVLGHVNDDVAVLESAIRYLTR